jgi:hypothetical protein
LQSENCLGSELNDRHARGLLESDAGMQNPMEKTRRSLSAATAAAAFSLIILAAAPSFRPRGPPHYSYYERVGGCLIFNNRQIHVLKQGIKEPPVPFI